MELIEGGKTLYFINFTNYSPNLSLIIQAESFHARHTVAAHLNNSVVFVFYGLFGVINFNQTGNKCGPTVYFCLL